jgi:hypothetical protein
MGSDSSTRIQLLVYVHTQIGVYKRRPGSHRPARVVLFRPLQESKQTFTASRTGSGFCRESWDAFEVAIPVAVANRRV